MERIQTETENGGARGGELGGAHPRQEGIHRHHDITLARGRGETLHREATGGVKGLHEAGPNADGAAERSPMWLLVIVLLNIVPGFEKITVLNTFATSEECQSERNRIGFEMAAAYPNDRDFIIACRLNPKQSS